MAVKVPSQYQFVDNHQGVDMWYWCGGLQCNVSCAACGKRGYGCEGCTCMGLQSVRCLWNYWVYTFVQSGLVRSYIRTSCETDKSHVWKLQAASRSICWSICAHSWLLLLMMARLHDARLLAQHMCTGRLPRVKTENHGFWCIYIYTSEVLFSS